MLHVLTHSFPTRRSSDLPIDQFDLFGRRVAQQLGFHVDRANILDRTHCIADFAQRSRQRLALFPCQGFRDPVTIAERSEEHTSELQSLMRTSYAVFCLKKKTSV